jgi:hypothetical protein
MASHGEVQVFQKSDAGGDHFRILGDLSDDGSSGSSMSALGASFGTLAESVVIEGWSDGRAIRKLSYSIAGLTVSIELGGFGGAAAIDVPPERDSAPFEDLAGGVEKRGGMVPLFPGGGSGGAQDQEGSSSGESYESNEDKDEGSIELYP